RSSPGHGTPQTKFQADRQRLAPPCLAGRTASSAQARDPPSPAIAAATFSGESGSDVTATPMASNTAHATAAAQGVIPLSPIPLFPKGWVGSRLSIAMILSNAGIMVTVGT